MKLSQVVRVLHLINCMDLGKRIPGHMHDNKPRMLVCRKQSQHAEGSKQTWEKRRGKPQRLFNSPALVADIPAVTGYP